MFHNILWFHYLLSVDACFGSVFDFIIDHDIVQFIVFRIMNILEMVQVGRYYYNPRTPSTVPQHRYDYVIIRVIEYCRHYFIFDSRKGGWWKTLKLSIGCFVWCCRLEVWPGYITSVSQNEGGLMLLVDASHRVLRTETVLQLM